MLIEVRACAGPDVNDTTISLIQEFEGFVPRPRSDPVGYATVGYGHKCRTRNCSKEGLKFPLTKDSASQLLKKDLKVFL